MAENRRAKGQGFYYFSRSQLTILLVGFTVVSVVIFSLGIFVGQGIEERKLLKRMREEPLAKIPIRPVPQGSGSVTGTPAEQEMTFYDTLTQKPPRAEGKSAEKKEAKAQGRKEAEATAKEMKPSVEIGTAAPSQKAEEETVPAPRKRERFWSVQVNAFPQERGARKLVERLKGKGYDAYMVSIVIRGRSWYRVRVGQLATRNEAKKLLQTLKEKEKFTKPIVTRSRK